MKRTIHPPPWGAAPNRKHYLPAIPLLFLSLLLSTGVSARQPEKPFPSSPALLYPVGTEFDEHIRHGCDDFTADKLAEAVTEFEAATALQPDSLLAHQDLAATLYRAGDVVRSAEEYQEAAGLSTLRDVFFNYLMLGFVSAEGKQSPHATASGSDPGFALEPPFAEMFMAESYDGLKEHDNAVTHFRLSTAALGPIHKKFPKATISDPDLAASFARPHRELGFCLLGKGQDRDAADEFSRAIEFAPDDPEAHLGLGLAEQGLGKTGDARREWQKYYVWATPMRVIGRGSARAGCLMFISV